MSLSACVSGHSLLGWVHIAAKVNTFETACHFSEIAKPHNEIPNVMRYILKYEFKAEAM